MKKLVKILAATTVAVATLAFVSCADGFANADGTEYTPPAAPAADDDDEPAEREDDIEYPFILDYDSTNADFEDVWDTANAVIYARVTNLGSEEEPNKVTKYSDDGIEYKTANAWKVTGKVFTDNDTSIEVKDLRTGATYTYKAPAVIAAGPYNLTSKTTIYNGVSTALTAAQIAALTDAEKTATVVTTTGDNPVSTITWATYTNKTLVEFADHYAASITVSGDVVTVAYSPAEYTVVVYEFTKDAAANNS